MKTSDDFDVLNVPLENKNLVEASAGTGKTFSIAVMVLRLILEKDINIKEILLVTYTNNAVAELDERIRLFLRSATDYASGSSGASGIIKQVVDKSKKNLGAATVLKRLEDSVLFLDETSVMTIHSFCNQTLNDLAFETGQLFESELVTNFDDILSDQTNRFWSSHITTLPVEILKLITDNKFDRKSIQCVVKDYMSGKRYYKYENNKKYKIDSSCWAELLAPLEELNTLKQNLIPDCESFISENRNELLKILSGHRFAKTFIAHIDDTEIFIRKTVEKREKAKYINEIFPPGLLGIIDAPPKLEEQLQPKVSELLDQLYCSAISEISAGITTHCTKAGIFSYDNLIRNLHIALQGENKEKIISALQQRYKAIFVDEFQDTDKLQYDIFMDAFGSNVVLFLIGDPKQSIYAFRQADINTYFKAYNDTDHRYSMQVNFRSSEIFINAMNDFFSPEAKFDTFNFAQDADVIPYVKVSSPGGNKLGYLAKSGVTEKGITISIQKNKDDVFAEAAHNIFSLLTDKEFKIHTSEKEKEITASDIGILVRNKEYGHSMKAALAKYNIPAVFVSDEKIMQSEEAKELFYVLKAIYDPAIENINAALVNNFTGFTSKDAIAFDGEQAIELFKNYKSKWESESIYSSLSAYISDFGISDHLRHPDTKNGLRIITNLHQLMELLYKTAYHQHLNQAELISWYRRAREIDMMEKDESEIRLENDANAVTIMTIHKSKGLEFNIVFAVQMDLATTSKHDIVSMYEGNEYITIPQKVMNENQKEEFSKQNEQENRRLMYVAVTRAVYKTFIFRNSYFKNSGLAFFIDKIGKNGNIEILEGRKIDADEHPKKYTAGKAAEAIPATLKNPFKLRDPFWRYMSYTALAAKPAALFSDHAATEFTSPETEYDAFVFQQLRKGNITGNMIHQILEMADFTNPKQHQFIISNAVNRFASSSASIYNSHLTAMVDHILSATIDTGNETFQLKEIPNDKKLSEMEFDFSTAECNETLLTDLLKNAGIPVQLKEKQVLHGLMKGFIDLFFLHNDKYYILDWKTNFLGDNVAYYSGAFLNDAMSLSNYHLQYIIYAVAIKKYLASRKRHFNYGEFGGILYCFVRGMRKDSPGGIFFARPSEKLIEDLETLLCPTADVS